MGGFGFGLGLEFGTRDRVRVGVRVGVRVLASALPHLQVGVVDWAPSVVALMVTVLVVAVLVLFVVAATRSRVETGPALGDRVTQ